MTAVIDHAHTKRATSNRKTKATALADTAAAAGFLVVELTGEHLVPDVARGRRRAVEKAAGLTRPASAETWQAALAALEDRLSAAAEAACSSCSSPVRWVLTELGKRMPLDPLPHPVGNVLPVATDAGPRARVLAGHQERPDDVPLYRSHFASCPRADAHRKPRRRPCAICQYPLHEALTKLGYSTHPCCDPDEQPTPPREELST